MTMSLDTLNLTILPYNDIGNNHSRNQSYRQNKSFSDFFKEENKEEKNQNNNVDNFNIRTWENVFRSMQRLNASTTMMNYKPLMAKASYVNLKNL